MLIEGPSRRRNATSAPRQRRAKRRRSNQFGAAGVLFIVAALALAGEARTSYFQARLFSAVVERFRYETKPGPSDSIRFPEAGGPYDDRLGYSQLPAIVARLEASGYRVTSQARVSEAFRAWMGWGNFAVYPEKSQAGLRIYDRTGQLLFERERPRQIYGSFQAVPPLVVETLRFIENREILDGAAPYRNPAVEWDRLGRAVVDLGVSVLLPWRPVSGGSTLATQLEKVRHSSGGATAGVGDKLRQMASASARAYLDGALTVRAQERIFVDYLDSIPLAAIAGYGEVHGLAEGLWAWYGADLAEVNRLLAANEASLSDDERDRRALAYRQTLALLLALGKPGKYLLQEPETLERRTDSFLRLLAQAGLISADLRRRALDAPARLRRFAPDSPHPSFVERKAVDALRAELAGAFGVDSLYTLDRFDVAVRSSLDGPAGRRITRALTDLGDPDQAARAGVLGYPMLSRGDPENVVYSFTLYERGDDANRLRVQADTWPAPLNINQGAKLELGSTAKLRTLTSYLKAFSDLHEEYGEFPAEALREAAPGTDDAITRWSLDWLERSADRDLDRMLEAAMLRRYSAHPGERFFTGGGVHAFRNFDADDNSRIMTVREAFERSVNLVFIRMMRDVTRYHMYRVPGVDPAILEDREHPLRKYYLRRFAQLEGRRYLTDFYSKYNGLGRAELLPAVADEARQTPKAVSVVHRYLRPNAEFTEFADFLRRRFAALGLSDRLLASMYESYGRDRFDLQDQGYLARVHPLELWLADKLVAQPEASLTALLPQSEAAIDESYRWLFKKSGSRAVNNRIRTVMEQDAFERIHAEWVRLGYPFPYLTPSYATAIGSSGDRPAALAELVGILLNNGVRKPVVRTTQVHFASGTPYETVLEPAPPAGQRVLPAAVARTVRREMLNVVEKGTGRRAAGVLTTAAGDAVPVGGKTGTGDNRFEEVNAAGRLIGSRAINRTGTFVFFIGDRFYGVITAYVPGEQADAYRFTSALPTQVFRNLAPALAGLFET